MEAPVQLEYAKNPRWANADHTAIDLTIKWDGVDFEIPFTASPNDCEEHGRLIFAAAASESFGPVAEHSPPPAPTAEQNKFEAQARLSSTDWVNQPDVYDAANSPHLVNRDAFIAYRLQVRAVIANSVAGNIKWPVEPSAVWS